MNDLRIVFMGTPDFAVASLAAIVNHGYNVVAVITAPDKPAGRGKKISESAVKKYASENNLNILQPTNLKSHDFVHELKSLNANLQVVVAFRMLPEVVWAMPERGTFNLHASLLPQYRGAAPINWAVINGETVSGVSTFFLDHKIDTGKIIFQEEVIIDENDSAGDLHDKLMVKGSKLVVDTVTAIQNNNLPDLKIQNIENGIETLKHAPKIFKADTKINWKNKSTIIKNHIRGMSPYPAAFTNLLIDKQSLSLKIYNVEIVESDIFSEPGTIITDNKTYFRVSTKDGQIEVKELQLAGKKRMNTVDFLRGFHLNNSLIAD